MPIWYRVANVFCLPSRGPGETWGLAVNEALACGCHVIVSDRVGCAEDVVDYFERCFRFQHDSITQLIELMNALSEKVSRAQKDEVKKLTKKFDPHAFAVAIGDELKS